MGKRSKEMKKRKRDNLMRGAEGGATLPEHAKKVKMSQDGATNPVLPSSISTSISTESLQRLCTLLLSISVPTLQDSFYTEQLKPLRRALWPVVASLVRAYEAEGRMTKKERNKMIAALEARAEEKQDSALLVNSPMDTSEFTNEDLQEALQVVNALRPMCTPASLPATTSEVVEKVDDVNRGQNSMRQVRKKKTYDGVMAMHMSNKLSAQHVSPIAASAEENKLRGKPFKQLRTVLHPFVLMQMAEESSSFGARISGALRDGRVEDALVLLQAMRESGVTPKLGAVQRWVRDCMNEDDFAGLASERAVRLLDAIVRLQMLTWHWEAGVGAEAVKNVEGEAASTEKVEGEEPSTGAVYLMHCAPSVRSDGGDHGLIDWYSPFGGVERRANIPQDPREISHLGEPCKMQVEGEEGVRGDEAYVGHFGTRSRETRVRKIITESIRKEAYRLVHYESGADRRPRNHYDLKIYSLPTEEQFFEKEEGQESSENNSTTISVEGSGCEMDSTSSSTAAAEVPVSVSLPLSLTFATPPSFPQKRVDVPMVPGAFMVTDVLSPSECDMIIALAEGSPEGYVPDEPLTSAAPPPGFAPRAAAFVFLSETITRKLYGRTEPFLPPTITQKGEVHTLAGLNTRLRFYRYQPGNIYRPHVDGAWPGSGLSQDGKYVYDIYGDRWSHLTFLVYLNDDFAGGETTFYTPGKQVGRLEAHSVEPRQGCVLLFPHGGNIGSLVHEGSPVARGAKYIIVRIIFPAQRGNISFTENQ